MAGSEAAEDDSPTSPNSEDLTIEEAVARVEEIIDTLEDGDVSLTEGKELHEEASQLLEYIEDEVALGDGDLERVDPS